MERSRSGRVPLGGGYPSPTRNLIIVVSDQCRPTGVALLLTISPGTAPGLLRGHAVCSQQRP